jgi:hypothetical protein
MINPDLVSYIQKQKAMGISEAIYRSALVSQGWKDEEITQASFASAVETPVSSQAVSSSDAAIAAWSFWTLAAVSLFHLVWFGFQNSFASQAFVRAALKSSGRAIFIGIVILVCFFEFLPLLASYFPYRKGKFVKQILLTIILFILSQAVLYVIGRILQSLFHI